MTRLKKGAALLLTVAVPACGASDAGISDGRIDDLAGAPTDATRAQELSVYDAVMRLPPPSLASDDLQLFHRRTHLPIDGVTGERTREWLIEQRLGFTNELLDAMVAANRTTADLFSAVPAEWSNRFVAAAIRLPGPDDFRKVWSAIHDRHGPDVETLVISRPGFNAALDTAVIHLMHSCGPVMCSSGEYLLLVREGTRWRLAHRVDVWQW